MAQLEHEDRMVPLEKRVLMAKMVPLEKRVLMVRMALMV
jgi:hypothetical protein